MKSKQPRGHAAVLGLALAGAMAGCDLPPPDPAQDLPITAAATAATATATATTATATTAAATIAEPATAETPIAETPIAKTLAEPAVPLPPKRLDDAIGDVVDAVFLPGAKSAAPRAVTIAPVVNGITGEQSAATHKIADAIAARLKDDAAARDITPFRADALGGKPIVVFATLTPHAADETRDGPRDLFRLCLAARDGADGALVGTASALVLADGVDATPTAFYRDSPLWISPGGLGTVRATCPPAEGHAAPALESAALTSEAIDAYEADHAREAAALFRRAASVSEGGGLDALTGLYLTASPGERATAFADLVKNGLQAGSFALKLQFRPDSKGFVERPGLAETYALWLGQIASQAAPMKGCLLVTGHTPTERKPPFTQSLSLARAHAVEDHLADAQPSLRRRIVATGVGDTEPLVGTGANDASDALDRRITIAKWPSCEGLEPPDDD